jgi:hypothetical protein
MMSSHGGAQTNVTGFRVSKFWPISKNISKAPQLLLQFRNISLLKSPLNNLQFKSFGTWRRAAGLVLPTFRKKNRHIFGRFNPANTGVMFLRNVGHQ